MDVTSEAAVQSAVLEIESRFGSIAGLVNAAGILGKMHSPERLRMSDWDRELAVDLRGTYLPCRALGPLMAQRGGGSIVNIASIAGMTSAPLHGYAPAKAAVLSLTETLAADVLDVLDRRPARSCAGWAPTAPVLFSRSSNRRGADG